MKKLSILLGLACMAGALTVGAVAANEKPAKPVAADGETVTKYIPVNNENFWIADEAFDKKSIADLTAPRAGTFHDGRRSYDALDNIIDTIGRVGEDRTGAIRSKRWVHTGGYVSFLLGGNNGNFVNIFKETDREGDAKRDIFYHIRSEFTSSNDDAWGTGYLDGTKSAFEMSCNMTLRYFYIPDEFIGQEFIVYIEDNTTRYYGGVTFGDLRVNQTLDEVTRTFITHKEQIAKNYASHNNDQTRWSHDYILNTYYKDLAVNPSDNDHYYYTYNDVTHANYYKPLIDNEALLSLDNADDGFEDYGLTNWVYDRTFSDAAVSAMVSDNDAKNWNERMPANKSGNYYLNADVSGVAEDQKYRFISNEFTLSGTGFISAKLGGGTAVMSLIDENGAELVTSRIAAAEGTNILNKGFKDAAVGNIMESGGRLNTMSRTYLDASAYANKGKKVRIVLSDDRTGGNWGLAYFDEVITKYTSVPTLKVDKIQQQWNDGPLYRGVVTDKYVGSSDTDFGKAYDFVQEYYGLIRAQANGGTYCESYKNNETKAEMQALITKYNNLSPEVKTLVNAAQDYDFGADATSENFYLTEANTDRTVGESLIAIDALVNTTTVLTVYAAGMNSTNATASVAITIMIVAAGTILVFFLRKRKEN